MATIFISHSSMDNGPAQQMKSWLTAEGYDNAFLDFDDADGLAVGEQWERRLYEEIARCHAVIMILTPNWLASKWCFVEFAQARALGKIIFPVIITPFGETRIAPEIQTVDLSEWNEAGKEKLRRRIREVGDEVSRGFAWDRSRPPYPGISAFEAADGAVFFGRDVEVREIIERLEARRIQGGNRLILILGASGSGKSSVLKAGVLPRLAREQTHWVVLPSFRPEQDPHTNFAKSLAEGLGDRLRWREIRDELNGCGPCDFLKEVFDNLRLGEARSATILISIDQIEELFTIASSAERNSFAELLSKLANPAHGLKCVIVGTLRSDVLEDLLKSQQFDLSFESYALRPLHVDSIVKVIEGPAGVAALTVERGLPELISQDARSADALPLLAFALRELYERSGRDRRLTTADYRALGDQAAGLTPIECAVRRKADDVLQSLRPKSDELLGLRESFVPHLVRIRDDGTLVRQPAPIDELPSKAHPLIDAFVEARLLTRRSDAPGGSAQAVVVEVSHEALFKSWPMLAGWLDDEHDFLAGKANLARSLAEWKGVTDPRKRPEALLQGMQLSRARQWRVTHPRGLTSEELSFIRASENRNTQRKWTAYGLWFLSAAVLSLVVGRAAYGEYIRRTALDCDLLAAEIDNNVGVSGIEFDKIDIEKSIPACDSAVRSDPENPRLIHNLGRSMEAAGRYAEASRWYRKAANLHWSWSQNNLGVLYLYGRGVPLDFSAGVALLRSAAEAGNGQARVNYTSTDFLKLITSNPDRVRIVTFALAARGLLQAGHATDEWTSAMDEALKSLKQKEQIADLGLSLRMLDVLGVTESLSESIQRRRGAK